MTLNDLYRLFSANGRHAPVIHVFRSHVHFFRRRSRDVLKTFQHNVCLFPIAYVLF